MMSDQRGELMMPDQQLLSRRQGLGSPLSPGRGSRQQGWPDQGTPGRADGPGLEGVRANLLQCLWPRNANVAST